jgi:hypothetical protein
VDLLTPDQHPGIALAADYAVRRVPWLAAVKHRWCGMADEDHAAVPRHYAHHVCLTDVICWAFAVKDLEPEHAAGICLHEYGHRLAGGDPGESDFEAEMKADRAVMEQLGIELQYRGPREIQWVDLALLR